MASGQDLVTAICRNIRQRYWQIWLIWLNYSAVLYLSPYHLLYMWEWDEDEGAEEDSENAHEERAASSRLSARLTRQLPTPPPPP